jgi:hypothetical protein
MPSTSSRPHATSASLRAFHDHNGDAHLTHQVTLTHAEIRMLNRIREEVAAKFLSDKRDNGTLPVSYRRLAALDVLLDQLGADYMPVRWHAAEAGAHDPWCPEQIAQYLGEKVLGPRLRAVG